MGCQLAVRVAKTICKELDFIMRQVIYLSDSTTAIWWIHAAELQTICCEPSCGSDVRE